MASLLARRERQGLTFRELSEETGIPVPTLSYWASKLRRESEPALVPVELVEDAPHRGQVTIETDQGWRVQVEPGFDAVHLARLLEVLRSC